MERESVLIVSRAGGRSWSSRPPTMPSSTAAKGGRTGWLATRDSGRVIVRVVRSGNGAGVRDVLVALDGKQLRFTDEESVARFEGVAPGVYVVASRSARSPPSTRWPRLRARS